MLEHEAHANGQVSQRCRNVACAEIKTWYENGQLKSEAERRMACRLVKGGSGMKMDF